MTASESQDTNAWLAEHVMGWKWWFGVLSLEIMLVRPGENWPERRGYKLQEAKPALYGKDITDLSCFKPTTEPADAMLVLEKCRERTIIAISSEEKTGRPMIGSLKLRGFGRFIDEREVKGFAVPDDAVIADTLPLAICKFARQLWEEKH